MSRVKFYYGLGSRYSYLAATQIAALEARFDVTFDWLPLDSHSLISQAQGDASSFAGGRWAGQYDLAYRDKDAARWASLYDVLYNAPRLDKLSPDDMALACWAFENDQDRRAVSLEIFAAAFGTGIEMNAQVLQQITQSHAPVRAPDPLAQAKTRHAAALANALADGVFGVPTFVIGQEHFWGNDRLVLLEQHLARLGYGRNRHV